METRWHVPEGVRLSDTKIEERSKELHISAENFHSITSHLTRQQDIEAALEAEELRKRAMKESSAAMTKQWTDSVQHQHELKQKELDSLMHKEDDRNLIRFLEVKKEQEAERRIYVDKMRQKLMQRKDFPKALGSAYLFSQVLHERERQKEFSRTIREHQVDVERQYHAAKMEDCAKYAEEEAAKRAKEQEKNQAYSKELMHQISTLQAARHDEREKRVQEELVDQERARRENERIERLRKEKADRVRREAKAALNNFMEVQKKERAAVERDNKNSDLATRIVQKSKDRIHSMMKQKEKEAMEARLAFGAKAFDNSAQLKRDAELKLIHDRGVEKFDADAREKQAHQEAKRKQLRKERQEDYMNHQLRNEDAKRRTKEVLKWDMLNRFKLAEEEAEFDASLKRDAAEKRDALVKSYDHELELKNQRRIVDEKAEIREIVEKNAADDKEYMGYAEEVRQLAADNGWPTFPIDRVISKYRINVMGEKKAQRCPTKVDSELCSRKSHYNLEPGRRTHCRASDPSVKCKHQKEKLYR